VPLISGKNDADRLANLTSEVPIGRLNLDIYAKQLRTGNARICRESRVRANTEPRSPQWAGIMEANEHFTFPPLPSDRHPVAGHPLPDLRPYPAYRPGNISEVLTEHYRRAHPEAFGTLAQ
jgi:hypothetical protein